MNYLAILKGASLRIPAPNHLYENQKITLMQKFKYISVSALKYCLLNLNTLFLLRIPSFVQNEIRSKLKKFKFERYNVLISHDSNQEKSSKTNHSFDVLALFADLSRKYRKQIEKQVVKQHSAVICAIAHKCYLHIPIFEVYRDEWDSACDLARLK